MICARRQDMVLGPAGLREPPLDPMYSRHKITSDLRTVQSLDQLSYTADRAKLNNAFKQNSSRHGLLKFSCLICFLFKRKQGSNGFLFIGPTDFINRASTQIRASTEDLLKIRFKLIKIFTDSPTKDEFFFLIVLLYEMWQYRSWEAAGGRTSRRTHRQLLAQHRAKGRLACISNMGVKSVSKLQIVLRNHCRRFHTVLILYSKFRQCQSFIVRILHTLVILTNRFPAWSKLHIQYHESEMFDFAYQIINLKKESNQ